MRAVADPINTTVGRGSICPNDEVVIPVTVSNCNGVAAISLALSFDNTKVNYEGYQNLNSAVSTMLVNQSNGTIYMTWANMSAVNVGDGTLLELRFTGLSGNTNLSWNTSQCEYSDVTGTTLQANYYNGSVNVYGVPNITSHPADHNLTEGQSSYFDVGASGEGLVYQWQVKTLTGNLWQDLTNDSHHSSVNSWRLYVNNVTMEMNGNQYRCVVSGTCPSPVTSRAALLNVEQFIPTIVTSVGSASTCPDEAFSVPITVTNCNNVSAISLALNYNASLVTYLGYENANEELANGTMRVNAARGTVYLTWASSNHALNIGDGTLVSLVFKSASDESSLSWNTAQCEYATLAGNSLPTSYNNGHLSIYYSPSINSHPSDRTVEEGSNTNFSISASGQGLSYQWQMSQDQGISWETLSNDTHYSNVNRSTLYVSNVDATMEGLRYRCVVNGTCEPSVTSNYGTLHVIGANPPIVTTAGSINTCSQTEFGIPISVTHCNNVGAISLALSYNTNIMTFAGYEGLNPELTNGQLQVNATHGVVFIAWASIAGANVGDGNLLTLNFTALSGTSGMNWNTSYCEYASPRGEPLPASYVNGNVSVGDLSFTITAQPTNQTVTMEDNATFTIATNGPTSGFQWQVSQDEGASWSNIRADEHYANSTTNTLNINNVPLEMNGYRYRCVVSGSCGVQYSSVAILTVQLPVNYYEIVLSVEPEDGGTVSGAGAHEEGENCTVTATPATGYNFVNWTESGIEVSQNPAYTFMVVANRELVAHFTLQDIDIVANVVPNESGTINGAGTYLYGDHVLLTAIPNIGFVFDNWTENGEVVSTNQSISFTAQTDRNLDANFSVQQVNITAIPVPASNGSVTGAGTFPYGTNVTLVALANEGFQLGTWTENDSVVSTSDTLTFMAETDRNLVANFIIKQLNITAVSDPVEGGTITGAGAYNYGDPVVLTATPLGQFEFLNWTENGMEVSMEPTISFNAYSHRNLVAHFFTTITIAATTQPEGSGVISGAGTYNYADPVTLTVLPNTGYTFVNWTENDTVYSTNNSISFTAYQNRSFVANFDMIMHHISVATNSEEAGTVSGGGDYQEGTQATVLAQPNENYGFVRWTENGASVSVNPSYTFMVWNDRNLVAEFKRQIIDTTAYSCDAFSWHGHTYTTNGIYYDTLTSYLGIDSVVALHLTIYPSYHFEFNEWDCNEYFWENTLYTESGDYYREYQTIHGCDSTLTMHLSIDPVQLGTFTYLSPTNGFPFTSLPISFSWEAVMGAYYYDLFIWDADEPMPDVPFVANLTSPNYSTTALQNNNNYKWCVRARNACHETMSGERTFLISIAPSLTVNTTHIDYGEVSMNQSSTYSVGVTGVVLEDELQVEIVGEDADMFSFVEATGWHNYNGGILLVTFTPTEPRYSYDASLVVTSGALTATTTLTGSLTNLLSFTTSVPEEIYSMNTPIPIFGMVRDWNNDPVEDVEVEVNVFVMGMRRTLQAVSDAYGQFSVMFEPMAGESGYYTVNSGRVGANSNEVHDSFNIPGISIVNTNQIVRTVTIDIPVADSILVKNKSNLPVHGITLLTTQAPSGCVITSSHTLDLDGLEEGYLHFTISGSEVTTGNNYQEVRLAVDGTSAGSTASTSFNLWYYCIEPRGALDVLPRHITTTMTKGGSKIVDVMVTNNGTGPTGTISISLPDFEWMSVVGNDTMPSLAVHDTTYFSLRLSPGQDVPLVPFSGVIGVNSERGDNVALDYDITAVSDSTGSFVIDATDDYTYNGDGRHLEGAYVTLKGYYSLETVAAGYTDASGVFAASNLPEGYYRLKVSAERHAEYNDIIEIKAGETNSMQIYMQYQAITCSWNVIPTEIEDEYTFDLDFVFETNVPVPVVTLDYYGIHPLEYGETADFTLIVTNHGLIDALETQLTFLDSDEYVFTPLYDIIDTVHAQTSVLVPGTYSRPETRNRVNRGSCTPIIYSHSYYYCNLERQWVQYSTSVHELNNGYCHGIPFHIFPTIGGSVPIYYGDGSIVPGGGSGGGPSYIDPTGPGTIIGGGGGSAPQQTQQESCTPCVLALANIGLDCFGGLPGCFVKAIIQNIAKVIYKDVNGVLKALTELGKDMVGCVTDEGISHIPIIGEIASMISCPQSIAENLGSCIHLEVEQIRENTNSKGTMDNLQTTIDNLYYTNFYVQEGMRGLLSYFIDEEWMMEENFTEFFIQFEELADTTGVISQANAEALASSFVGTSIDSTIIMHFIDRWNRTQEYHSLGYFTIEDLPVGYDTNFVQVDTVVTSTLAAIEEYYENEGYEDLEEAYDEAVDNAVAIIERAGRSSVCSSVKVRFSQTLTMTREAFEGTFTVHNGHDSKPLEDVEVAFKILDDEGHVCNSLFQITPIVFNELTQIDGSGSLGAGLDGSAIIQFIPTKNAAPTVPKNYFFGGTFSFTDPFTDEYITYDLYPVELTINPSPDLYVDYFMQRDILGDDALTEDVVEPSIPAELGVRIHNQGAGTAKNVSLETAEPVIIDNEKGLAIDFAMYGASFNGSPTQLRLMDISFGNIASGTTAVAEWLFTSSLLGHFASYEAHVIHNNSFGNPELSLVSSLRIHELIHPIRVYGNGVDDGINDFLVNDVMDMQEMPDTIYFSQGGQTGVGVANDISFDHYVEPNDTIVTLTVDPSRIGWNYGVCDDPGMDKYEIVSCTRDFDGQVIPIQNVWQTFVTLIDENEPDYENKLHIVDTIPNEMENVTYTLVYSLKSDLLEVEEIIGIPTEGYIDYPLSNFQVKFNKPIIDSTFTYEDMVLKCQNGPNRMDSTVVITKLIESLYDVSIAGLTNDTGYYVLTVHTLDIKDEKGYGGYNGKQSSWVQLLNGITQSMTLQAGWNWWSTYIEQGNINGLTMLEHSLGHKGVTIKSQYDFVQNFHSDYGEDVWFGSLDRLTNEQGYMIDVTEDCTSEMRGVRTDPTSHPITILPNWNWIGYPVDSRQSIASAIAGFNASPEDLIKSHFEFSTYYEGFGWFPDDLMMTPGEGYFYYSNANESQVLVYNNVDRDEILPEKSDQRLWKTNVHAFADNISIMAVVSIDSIEQRDENLELGAFVNGECRGSARLKHFGPSDRYYAMLSVAGQEGDKVEFGFINKERGQGSMSCENHITFVRNGIMGSLDAPYIVKFSTSTEAGHEGSMVLFPNPVERNKTFNLDIPKNEMLKEIVIVDMLGEEVLRKTGALKSNEITGLPVAGIYVVKAITESGHVYHGRLIVK
jgi:hypothetical protein